eukprot:Lithocolla_globosa_v1_NODE_37_length_8440_cov_24.995110.p5 type:complete len:101 gc:universal NODE_37_length_8440_cov_24.995110:7176-6874(-)
MHPHATQYRVCAMNVRISQLETTVKYVLINTLGILLTREVFVTRASAMAIQVSVIPKRVYVPDVLTTRLEIIVKYVLQDSTVTQPWLPVQSVLPLKVVHL